MLKKQIKKANLLILNRLASTMLVPTEGLEPPHLTTHGPEPCASTNSATWAAKAGLYEKLSQYPIKNTVAYMTVFGAFKMSLIAYKVRFCC